MRLHGSMIMMGAVRVLAVCANEATSSAARKCCAARITLDQDCKATKMAFRHRSVNGKREAWFIPSIEVISLHQAYNHPLLISLYSMSIRFSIQTNLPLRRSIIQPQPYPRQTLFGTLGNASAKPSHHPSSSRSHRAIPISHAFVHSTVSFASSLKFTLSLILLQPSFRRSSP